MKRKTGLPDVILRIGLPLTAAAMIYIYITAFTADRFTLTTLRQFTSMIEHVLMSLTLIIGGAFLASTGLER